jgi:YD repeat-containing protein
MRFLSLIGLLAMATRCLAQRADSTHSITMSSPIQLSPLAMLVTLPPVLSPDDSLRQRAYRRNRAKTVALVQLRNSSPTDTIDYTELDREGHIMRYHPAFGQSYRQRYNRQHQLLERTSYPTDPDTPLAQITYDPATKTTTTQLGPSLTQLTPWQVARSTRHGDTLLVESFFHPTAQVPASPVRRMILRSFRTGLDTVRTDLLVYNVSEQLLQFESYYRIGSRQQPRESGIIDFGAPRVATERQTPSEAQRLLGASRRTHGRYLPTTRFTYNAQGSLVRSFFIPLSYLDKSKTTTTANDQGTMTITTSTITDTSSVRYVRAPDGQLLREEYHYHFSHTPLPGNAASPALSFTEYTYLPNGLRKTKSGSMPARYEYRYTYY